MQNAEIAAIFDDIAELLKLRKDNIFKIRAYQKVARAIRDLPLPVSQMAAENKLREIPGVGEEISKKITEIINTGGLAYYERLKQESAAQTGP
jgi:DNA polymerase (family 10)